jgi:streptogramin lyase
MKSLSLIVLLGIAVGFGLQCSKPPTSVAGGTDIGNPGTVSGKIVDTMGIAQDSVTIRLLPAGYNPVTEGTADDSLLDTTNAIGEFAIKNINKGIYTLTAVHIRKRSMLRIDTIFVDTLFGVDLKTDTLRPPVHIRFTVPDSLYTDSGFVFIPGTQRFLAVTAPGTFFLDSVSLPLPKLQYYSIKTGSIVASTQQLNVALADTAVSPQAVKIDTIPFTGVSLADVAADSSGNVWFSATSTGAIMYDGVNVNRYTFVNALGKHVTVSKPNTAWFCDTDGVCSYDGTTWAYYAEAAGSIQDLAADTNGDVWFAAQDSILMLDRTLTPAQIVTKFKGSKGITTVYADPAGTVWFGCDSGLIRYDTAFHAITSASIAFPAAGSNTVTKLEPIGCDSRGALIVRSGQYGDSVWTFDGNIFTHFGPEGAFTPGAAAVDNAGVMWVAALQGIFLYNSTGWHPVDLGPGLPPTATMGVCIDKSGKIWFAGPSGAFRFDGSEWKCFVGKQ